MATQAESGSQKASGAFRRESLELYLAGQNAVRHETKSREVSALLGDFNILFDEDFSLDPLFAVPFSESWRQSLLRSFPALQTDV